MNFFKLYIGDYQRDTAHLSVTEHGAYMLMLQHYYATEKPLPTGKALHRMLRAQDRAEREAIDAVAAQFWTTTADGLVNHRADAEITKAATQADTNARIAREREAKRKAKQIVPRTEHESCSDRATNDQPNQTPDTRQEQDQKPITFGDSSPALPLGDPPADHEPVESGQSPCPHEAIIALFHEKLPTLPRIREWTPGRAAMLRARWRERSERQTLDWWADFFEYVGQSDFLSGRSSRSNGHATWECSLPWLLRAENFVKVLEGHYENRSAA